MILFYIFIFYTYDLLHEGKHDVKEEWVSCRDGGRLLVAKHGLDHLTTTNGENGEEGITQL